MAIALYMDVHVPQAITDQLRRRSVDVLTAIALASEPEKWLNVVEYLPF
ncbi:MAG: hypothetical protein KME25_19725 [Symplocastrum torsivum CPER-KK1]|uniref:DUF5615 domain-containing protein n=1 Tax=Symplocastrum torsivum CPER-KK1 TaxID=450513 RepID=A0A951PNY5_9CYAN|nr:hypothetical protein [Symplocastrum torsivum CPER-KK1]